MNIEAIFFKVHVGGSRLFAGVCARPCRVLLAFAMLAYALVVIGLFATMHTRFVSVLAQPSALTKELAAGLAKLPEDGLGVLHVEIVGPWSVRASIVRDTVHSVYWDELQANLEALGLVDGPTPLPRPSSRPEAPLLFTLMEKFGGSVEVGADGDAVGAEEPPPPTPSPTPEASAPDYSTPEGLREIAPDVMALFDREVQAGVDLLESEMLAGFWSNPKFLFSYDAGLLHLSTTTREDLGVPTINVTLDCASPLFGSTTERLLLQIVGYRVPITNALVFAGGEHGFLKQTGDTRVTTLATTKDVLEVEADSATFFVFRVGTLLSAVFLLYAMSSLVSFVLSQTQVRMLQFTSQLQFRVRRHLPLSPLVGFHMIDSLVFVPIMLGVLFFLTDVFSGDQTLAFLTLVAVWTCELYSAISCRTIMSINIFPRVFLFALTTFLVYTLSSPEGFVYLSLWSACASVKATMYILWHLYEEPALASGLVSAANPRQARLPRPVPGLHFRVRMRGVPPAPAQQAPAPPVA